MKIQSLLFVGILGAAMTAQAASITLSGSAPAVDEADIAQLTGGTGHAADEGDVWGGRPVMGQSFTTGTNPKGYTLDAFSLKSHNSGGTNADADDQQYTFRIGSISGTVFTPLASGTAIPTGDITAGDWLTMTFTSPVTLSPSTTYAVDIEHDNTPSFWGWRMEGTASSSYAGGSGYTSGVQGGTIPDDSNLTLHSFDRTFHVNLVAVPNITLSSSAPTVDEADIAQLTGGTGHAADEGDVWGDRPAMGQSFTTGANAQGYTLDKVSFKSAAGDERADDQQYTFRIGTMSGSVFTPLASVSSVVDGTFTAGDWWTMEFIPITLSPNTTYAADVLHENTPALWGWRMEGTASSSYAGGSGYTSGASGGTIPDDSNLTLHSFDRTFHVNLVAVPSITLSSSAPTVDEADIAQLTGGTGHAADEGDAWGGRPAMGQSFTTGANAAGYTLDTVSFKSFAGDERADDQQYTFRVGTISGSVFTPLVSESSVVDGTFTAGDWWTMEFSGPITLSPNTTYAVDVLHENTPALWGWRMEGTASSSYAGGSGYSSGVLGGTIPDDSNLTLHSFDRTFHINLVERPGSIFRFR